MRTVTQVMVAVLRRVNNEKQIRAITGNNSRLPSVFAKVATSMEARGETDGERRS
jgi:hypothetical protein